MDFKSRDLMFNFSKKAYDIEVECLLEVEMQIIEIIVQLLSSSKTYKVFAIISLDSYFKSIN